MLKRAGQNIGLPTFAMYVSIEASKHVPTGSSWSIFFPDDVTLDPLSACQSAGTYLPDLFARQTLGYLLLEPHILSSHALLLGYLEMRQIT